MRPSARIRRRRAHLVRNLVCNRSPGVFSAPKGASRTDSCRESRLRRLFCSGGASLQLGSAGKIRFAPRQTPVWKHLGKRSFLLYAQLTVSGMIMPSSGVSFVNPLHRRLVRAVVRQASELHQHYLVLLYGLQSSSAGPSASPTGDMEVPWQRRLRSSTAWTRWQHA